MRAAGAPEAIIRKARLDWLAKLPENPLVEVFPENIAAFRVLLATGNQWETPGLHGGRLTLPLGEIDVAMRRLDVPDSEFLRILVMVRAAREVKVEQFDAATKKR